MQLSEEQIKSYSLDLMLASNEHRGWHLGNLGTYLLLPVKHNRIRVYLDDNVPVGLITWCWMYPEDAEQFLQGNYHPTENDFKYDDIEGKELWGLEFIAPYGHARKINRLIRNEIREMYGPQPVNWRRNHSKQTKRTKRFG